MTTKSPLANVLSGVLGGLIVLVIGAVLIATDVIDTGDTKTVVRADVHDAADRRLHGRRRRPHRRARSTSRRAAAWSSSSPRA